MSWARIDTDPAPVCTASTGREYRSARRARRTAAEASGYLFVVDPAIASVTAWMGGNGFSFDDSLKASAGAGLPCLYAAVATISGRRRTAADASGALSGVV